MKNILVNKSSPQTIINLALRWVAYFAHVPKHKHVGKLNFKGYPSILKYIS